MLGKAKNHFIFSIESVGQVPVWSPNKLFEDGGKGYSDGKAKCKIEA